VAGGWWLVVAGGWWLVAGGWWSVAAARRAPVPRQRGVHCAGARGWRTIPRASVCVSYACRCVVCVVCVARVLDGIGDPQSVLLCAAHSPVGRARGAQSAAAALSALAHALAETGSLAIVRYVKRNKGNPHLGCLSPRTSRDTRHDAPHTLAFMECGMWNVECIG
jgi:hypothetical protein